MFGSVCLWSECLGHTGRKDVSPKLAKASLCCVVRLSQKPANSSTAKPKLVTPQEKGLGTY